MLSPKQADDVDGERESDALESIQMRPFLNIIFGAFADNIGSLGLVPLALSPVMYEIFSLNFFEEGLTPVMSENQVSLIVSYFVREYLSELSLIVFGHLGTFLLVSLDL